MKRTLVEPMILLSLLLAFSVMFFVPVRAASSSRIQALQNAVTVSFSDSNPADPSYIATKYNVPILLEDNDTHFALFSPQDNNAFIKAMQKESVVKSAVMSPSMCILSLSCGGGGGGGGGGATFSMSTQPAAQLTVLGGSSATATITVASQNGYAGTVNFSVWNNQCPKEVTGVTFSPSSASVTSGGSNRTSITILTQSNATYSVNPCTIAVQGSDSLGSASATANVIINLANDFALSILPFNANLPVSSTGAFSVTVASKSPGTIAVSLVASVMSGLTATLNPTTVSVPSSGQATSALTVGTGAIRSGTYIVTVSGTSGAESRGASVTVTIPFPSDPLFKSQWALPELDLPNAWARTTGTGNVVVAVVDDGVWLQHPDLQGNLWTNPVDGSHGWDEVNNNNQPLDDNGHGTAVAGVVGAVIDNGLGIAGVGNEKIMVVRSCFWAGAGTGEVCNDPVVAAGIDWAVDHGASVINLSLGGPPGQDEPRTHAAVQYAASHNVLVVAAAGNDSTNTVECPACYDEVIAVTALKQGQTLASFSNYGSKLELSAPGTHIYTTCSNVLQFPDWVACLNNATGAFLQYGYVSGTSFAAPYVSGLVALGLDYYRTQVPGGTMTSQMLRDALDFSAAYLTQTTLNFGTGPNKDLSPSAFWNDHFGYGEPDANAFLAELVSPQPYTLTASWQFFGSSGTEGSAHVSVTDTTSNKVLTSQTTVANGLTLNVTPGHEISVQYQGCFNDGSHNVSVNHVDGSNGAPSFSGGGFTFIMGTIPESHNGVYYVVLGC